MDPYEKRKMIIRKIKNSFVKCAENDETVSEKLIITEICKVHGVSIKTAHGYIQELIDLDIIKKNDDMLWHIEEKEIKQIYLETEENVKP